MNTLNTLTVISNKLMCEFHLRLNSIVNAVFLSDIAFHRLFQAELVSIIQLAAIYTAFCRDAEQ